EAFERERRDQRQHKRVEFQGAGETGIHASVGQLRQIVWNLLRNAADAMPDGGAIKVVVARDPESARVDRSGAASGAASGGPWVTLVVTDTGSGIPKTDLDRIFEPFFSTKNAGTGLGLATVARIVDDHRGTIEVASETGRGTTVTIRLPAAQSASRAGLEHAA
ncbi:MAG: ATP-binding protein, partial [Deltaproteobacteria bacterium]|nr:ATP-binding protein [Deltaproteobacteria bacterium]